jgi:hypothetical protein
MKNRLIALGFAALVAGGATLPASAQSSMSNSMSGPTAESAMSKLHDDMSAMKSTGNPDKDYLMDLKMLRGAMHTLMMSEMAHGKNAEVKAATKHAMATNSFKTFDALDQKFITE